MNNTGSTFTGARAGAPLVADLDAGPISITLPDAGKRFRSMMVVNEDHYIVGDVI